MIKDPRGQVTAKVDYDRLAASLADTGRSVVVGFELTVAQRERWPRS